MNVLFILAMHVLRALAILLGSGGSKALMDENLLLKQQLLVLNGGRKRAPRVSPFQRLFLGFWCQFLSSQRSGFSSFRGAPGRNDTPGIPRSPILLEFTPSGGEASGIQNLFQR